VTHTVSPPALDRASRAPGLASVTSANEAVPTPDVRDEPLGLDLAATIGLIAYAITVAIGFSRVFTGWDFLEDLVVIAVVGHGVSYVSRRLRVPAFVAIPVVLVVLTWLVAWIYYPDTFSGVFPLADTWEAVRADFRLVRDDFQSTTPPVDYVAGWAFLAGATMAATVWLADTFAFRAQARGEALVPGAVLFVFVAALGVDERRMVTSLAVIGAGYCALALLRQRLERRPRTVLGRSLHPLVTTVPAIACAGFVVIAGAWVLGPNLPGADAEPLFDTHNDRGGVTEIVSPLVDIRSRIVNQAENELFAVGAELPSYWRAAALSEFDGEQWSLPETILDEVDGKLDPASPGSVHNEQLTTILGLEGALVPAAAEPVLAEGPGLGFNSLTDTLVKTSSELDRDDTYAIESQMPRFAAEALRAASTESPPDPVFLELPDDLPAAVTVNAREVTAGQPTPFDQMVALQDWFRTEFTYSTEIPEGHGNSAIESFLEDRVGYCEQFAGTFAAMARALGVPARVAVGFTQGELQEDGSYLVLGRNAHAWPEVWFDGYGWVPFEPTPGRGMPGAEAYTGIPPQQEGDPPATTTTTTTTTSAPAPTTTVAGQAVPPPPPPPAATTTTTAPNEQSSSPPPDDADGSSFPWLALLGVIAVIGLLVALPEIVRRWRRRRRAPITDPAHALLELWDRALRALSATGFRGDPALTPIEVSEQAAAAFPAVGVPLRSLAVVATAASYAPNSEVVELADADRQGHGYDGPHGWCALVEGTVEDSLSLSARVKRYFTVWH
jgi:transglutaminase-like putative cysteine protease